MNKPTVYGLAVFAAASFGPFSAAARAASVQSCADINVQFANRPALTGESEIRIPRSEASVLEISPSESGGVWLEGADRSDFLVTLCKAVPDDGRGEVSLGAIELSRGGNRLGVRGPDSGEWVAHLLVRAPKNASVELNTHNGPVSVRGFDGRASITSENGPVSLRRSSGQIDVRTTNGPIHFEGGSGNIHLEAENGPLSVRLQNAAWDGGGLEGRTQNGPVHLDIAENYPSGVRVETAGRSPVHCGAEACRKARRNWDDESKTIEFGPAKASVRISTENGPVSISGRN